jgi:uncharacterized protein YjbI with pentapeptide repeats
MTDRTAQFDVTFHNLAGGPTHTHIEAFLAVGDSVLYIAAPGNPAVVNELNLELSIDPWDKSSAALAPDGPAVLYLDFSGYLRPAEAANIGVDTSGWSIAPRDGTAIVEVSSRAPLTGKTADLTLTTIVVTGTGVTRPVIRLNDQTAASVEQLLVVQKSTPTDQPLDLKVTLEGPGLVPVGDDTLAQHFRVVLDAGSGLGALGGKLTVWFDTCPNDDAPGATDLGCYEQVAQTFGVTADPQIPVHWISQPDANGSTPPSWSFVADPSQELLPSGRAALTFSGNLPTLTPTRHENGEGLPNVYVHVTGVPGYLDKLAFALLTKTKPIREIDVTATAAARARSVHAQNPGLWAVDVTPLTGQALPPATVSMSVSVGEGVERLAHAPYGDPLGAEQRALDPVVLDSLSLPPWPAATKYVLEARDGNGTALERRGVAFAGFELAANAQLGGLVLERADLTGVHLESANLEGARLAGATLTNAHLNRAILTGADLTNATMTGADVTSADFDHVQLRGAKDVATMVSVPARIVDIAKIQTAGGTGSGVKLHGYDLTNTDLRGVDLRRCDLGTAKLAGTWLAGAKLGRADLRSATFSAQTDLTGADLGWTWLDKAVALDSAKGVEQAWINAWTLLTRGPTATDWAQPAKCDFRRMAVLGVDLSNLTLSGARFDRADLTEANLSRANVSGATFTGAVMGYANLRGIIGLDQAVGFNPKWELIGSLQEGSTRHGVALAGLPLPVGPPTRRDLSKADLSYADLTGVGLYEMNLTGANLHAASLRGADLRGSVLAGADVTSADLTGANLGLVDLETVVGIEDAIDHTESGGSRSLVLANLRRHGASSLGGKPPPVQNLAEAWLPGCDLSGADLTGVNLFHANLEDAKFDGATLEKAQLAFARLGQADIAAVKSATGANVPYVNWKGVKGADKTPGLDSVAVVAWKLVNEGALAPGLPPLPDLTLTGVVLDGVQLPGADVTGMQIAGSAVRLNLAGAKVNYFELTGVRADEIDLSGATGTVGFFCASLRGAKLTGLDLGGGAYFCDFTGADLTNAKLPAANPKTGSRRFLGFNLKDVIGFDTLSGVTPSIRRLYELQTKGARGAGMLDSQGVDLMGGYFNGVDLTDCDLRNATLAGCVFSGAEMAGVKLGGATFGLAFLGSCDLSQVDLTGTDLRKVLYDDATIWPAGFDPVAAGANNAQADPNYTDPRWVIIQQKLGRLELFDGTKPP